MGEVVGSGVKGARSRGRNPSFTRCTRRLDAGDVVQGLGVYGLASGCLVVSGGKGLGEMLGDGVVELCATSNDQAKNPMATANDSGK
jgi:hypothetical protein